MCTSASTVAAMAHTSAAAVYAADAHSTGARGAAATSPPSFSRSHHGGAGAAARRGGAGPLQRLRLLGARGRGGWRRPQRGARPPAAIEQTSLPDQSSLEQYRDKGLLRSCSTELAAGEKQWRWSGRGQGATAAA